MEGLVKGLINVALGDNDDDGNGRRNDQSREERSRSTWAQVVSEEKDHEDDRNRRGQGQGQGQHTASYQRPYQRREEEWESDCSQGRLPEGHPREDDGDNDGWETVHKKPSKRRQKVPKEKWNDYKKPPTEQNYANEVDCRGDLDPSEEELYDLAKAANKLWELDLNRLVPGKDYEIDCGDGKKVYQKEDMAEGSLFAWLSDDILRRPTYSRFCSLLDNYNPHEGYKEVVTPEERQEQAAFIEEISRTAPIKYLYKYLLAKGKAPENYQDFKRILTSLWFDLYGRGGTSSCSSAFEHVFVGEIKSGQPEVSGFHNWIQFYLEESKGNVDYQGYIFPRRRGDTPDSETQLLTIQFEWNGILKAVSSTLIGVSPEFEIALYTLCFYLGEEDNHVELGPYNVNVKCYRHGNKLGSAFPVT
ncbi:uncharacterized protein LOC127260741 isoform X3 [Andrographis paniculata]|uniref:uncharacterized protein LOC127260741 isoform X3 n=1 Tax=Andrographis paniculata TaxID=175694 RepID=UPI0021E76746|nr:uncharacterized protein LOC127260741 isoform X3 [Andrographis paniculata]